MAGNTKVARKRNPVARALRRFKKAIMRDKTKYRRKMKHRKEE